MINRYIPYLSWESRNLVYTLAYSEFKHNPNQITKHLRGGLKNLNPNINIKGATVKVDSKRHAPLESRLRPRKIKNNQFNIKWFFNRYLKFYYKDIKLSNLINVETRLDIILFRTNWFSDRVAVVTAIKKGLITLNNKISTGYVHLKPGDIIQLTDDVLSRYNVKLWLNSHLAANSTDLRLTNISHSNTASMILSDWHRNYNRNIIPNVSYLEINNNTKSLVMLKNPKYNEIPYPFNLRKFRS
jgi:ribosomal protein S4